MTHQSVLIASQFAVRINWLQDFIAIHIYKPQSCRDADINKYSICLFKKNYRRVISLNTKKMAGHLTYYILSNVSNLFSHELKENFLIYQQGGGGWGWAGGRGPGAYSLLSKKHKHNNLSQLVPPFLSSLSMLRTCLH